jgi:hypothetical protein
MNCNIFRLFSWMIFLKKGEGGSKGLGEGEIKKAVYLNPN